MKALGLSQTALAKRMKVSRPYVTKVLSGDVNISFRTAAKFAHALQMDFFPVLKPIEDAKTDSNLELEANKVTGGSTFEIDIGLNGASMTDVSGNGKEARR